MDLLERADILANRGAGTMDQRRAMRYQQDAFNAAREAFGILTKALNSGDRKAVIAGLLDAITHEHRYLQNSAIWALLTAMGAFGGLPDRFTDARNESAHKACRDIREVLGDRIYWPDPG